MTKKSCRSKLQHATSPSALHKYSSPWTMKYTPKDNASNKETAYAHTVIIVTQPTKARSKVFTRGSHSSESKQYLQQGHCQVQQVKVSPGNFFPEPMNRYQVPEKRSHSVLLPSSYQANAFIWTRLGPPRSAMNSKSSKPSVAMSSAIPCYRVANGYTCIIHRNNVQIESVFE